MALTLGLLRFEMVYLSRAWNDPGQLILATTNSSKYSVSPHLTADLLGQLLNLLQAKLVFRGKVSGVGPT